MGSVTLQGFGNVSLTGVSSAISIGTVGQSNFYNVTGVSLTTSIGAVDPVAVYPVTGISLSSGTTRPGIKISASFSVNGVSATTSVGNGFAFVWSEVNPNVTNEWDEVETAA